MFRGSAFFKISIITNLKNNMRKTILAILTIACILLTCVSNTMAQNPSQEAHIEFSCGTDTLYMGVSNIVTVKSNLPDNMLRVRTKCGKKVQKQCVGFNGNVSVKIDTLCSNVQVIAYKYDGSKITEICRKEVPSAPMPPLYIMVGDNMKPLEGASLSKSELENCQLCPLFTNSNVKCYNYWIRGFSVAAPRQNGKFSNSNKFSENQITYLKSQKAGTQIQITNIKYNHVDGCCFDLTIPAVSFTITE